MNDDKRGLPQEYSPKGSFYSFRIPLVGLCVFLLLSAVLPACSNAAASNDQSSFEKERIKMVAGQIKARGVVDAGVLRAMSTVPRHLFVPESLRGLAYTDGPLPIGHGQTISQPYIVAYMTEILHIKPHHRVLEIGTGSGYQAAVLAELTDQVYSIEIISKLADSAARRLKKSVMITSGSDRGDGYYGWPEADPFDAIMVTAAAEFIPPPLLRQLRDGGRMVIPVGSPFYVQHLMLVEKEEGRITTRSLMPVRFVPFRRAP